MILLQAYKKHELEYCFTGNAETATGQNNPKLTGLLNHNKKTKGHEIKERFNL